MKIHLIMMLLLILCLSSCKQFQINCDASFIKDRCRCRCLDTDTLKITNKENCKKDWTKYFYGTPENHPVNYDIMMCEGLSGFRIEEIAKDVIPMIKEERARCEDLEATK